MRARWLCLAALALAPLATGCGEILRSSASVAPGKRLTVYSSLPLQGPQAAAAQQVLAGERQALAAAHGRAGRMRVKLVSLSDSNPSTAEWEPGLTEANAKLAARDPTTIAYIGDYGSAATAVSLPILNGAGILQVSPGSPYVGLTSSLDAGQDEPERFYPTGLRTFGRVDPGDPVQAAALAALMRSLSIGSVYVIADQDPFDGPLAQLLSTAAGTSGIAVSGQDTLDIQPASTGSTSFAAEVAKVEEAKPQAVFLSALPTTGAANLLRQLHAALPALVLLGSASLAHSAFTSQLGPAARSMLLATLALPPRAYGYESMSAVLACIRAAGRHGDERSAVVARFFAIRHRRSVLGTYSMQPSGEPTLSRYGVARVRHGTPVPWRTFSVRPVS